jgi:hypothetical protein
MFLYQFPTHYQGYVLNLQLSLLSLQYMEQQMGTFSKEVASQFISSQKHYSFSNFHHIPALSSELYICTSDSTQFIFCGIMLPWLCNISKLVK